MPLPNLLRRLFGREEPLDIPRQSAAPSPSKEDALHRAVAVIRRLREECRTDDRVRIEAAIAEATNSGVDPEELKRVSAEAESKKTRGRKAKPARSGSGEATPSPEESSTTDALVGSTIEFPSSGPFPVAVVGESRRQATLKQLAGTRLTHGESVVFTAAVVPEPKNSFDPNAIAIYVHGGGQVGYLAREDALELKAVSQALLAQKSIGLCRARLIGGTENKPSIGVMLDLADCQTLLDHISPAGAPF